MSLESLLKALADHSPSEEIVYTPYRITDNKITYGIPPIQICGLDHISARHNFPQTGLFMSLTGAGVFASNRNQSGIIEIGLLDGSISCGGIEAMALTGIPFPIAIVDVSSAGTSGVLATACRQVETPEWRREATAGVAVYTFKTPRLIMSHGFHLPAIFN
jgi:hypothetical protein